MKPSAVDANVIVRFFLNDHPLLSTKAKKYFESCRTSKTSVYVDEVIVAEVVWVLGSVYQMDKTIVISLFEKFLSQTWVTNPRKKSILKALSRYAIHNVSFIDCWIWTISKSNSLFLVTFDKSLDKLAKSS